MMNMSEQKMLDEYAAAAVAMDSMRDEYSGRDVEPTGSFLPPV